MALPMSGRRATDWLEFTPKRGDPGDRREADRRGVERRAPRRKIDPLFVTTLINQIKPPVDAPRGDYTTPKTIVRAGVMVNLRA